MARRITSLFFLLVMLSGVMTGNSFGESGMDKKLCPMKCCKKTAKKKKAETRNAVEICRTLNCNMPTPANSSSSYQISFAAIFVALKTLPLFQFLISPKSREKQVHFVAESRILKNFQPKYIKNHSFLI
jgi:hypothetical protein